MEYNRPSQNFENRHSFLTNNPKSRFKRKKKFMEDEDTDVHNNIYRYRSIRELNE